MVPYTLSKRRQDSIKLEKAKSMKAKMKGKPQTSGDGSDSDEEPVSFFSHLEDTSSSNTAKDSKASANSSVLSLNISPLTTPPSTVSTTSDYSVASVSGPVDSTAHNSPYVSINTIASTATSSPSHTAHSQPSSQSSSGHYSWDQHSRRTAHPVIAPYTAQPYTYQHSGHATQGAGLNTSQDTGADAVSQSDPASGGDVEMGGGGLLGGTGPGITIDEESVSCGL